ncbi:hypothetical protein HPB51_027882 [Rhipicephalus microplus]|uniref:Uncharacterized protein n=1 Tax=Rhipicephalus microplus TaxID=6941 RepID=A0A9J6CYQ6_RHIMP|nr:hypothetical protein HPB51_027882 [Rhipicephalus microplus]
MPRLPAGFEVVSADEYPEALVLFRQSPFDVCPILVTRLMGMTFDHRLFLVMHANTQREKVESLMASFSALARLQGGRLRPEHESKPNRSFIFSAITYASALREEEHMARRDKKEA